ncbi:hypothetical protein [Treponema pedis]|uniref:hypothetical protein n=1 Tax=Treponema pedis TaxID=409322 RepID=UPI003D220542
MSRELSYIDVIPYIQIEKFGPIYGKTESIPIKKLTVFIGPQGSGKSTIAKLVSCFTWLEKSLVKGIVKESLKEEELKRHLKFNQIDDYLASTTKLVWKGINFNITYENKKVVIKPKDTDYYHIAKIMYVPAERNFLSSFRFSELKLIDKLSQSLLVFLIEFDNSKSIIKKGISLPIKDVLLEYDKLNDIISIRKNEKKVYLENAASGFQTMTPLFLVTEFLSNLVDGKSKQENEEFSFKDIGTFDSEVERLLVELRDSDVNINAFKKKLIKISSKYSPSYFFNIVEEPEQNLFPNSQKNVIEHLLKCLNKNKYNRLLITTHSPYILETINNVIYADKLKAAGKNVDSVISSDYHVSYDDVSAYMVKDGIVQNIKLDDIKQIDPSEVDSCSDIINNDYTRLEEIEYGKS